MSVKINELQIENVKRIKAVKLEPTPNGLTIVGGRNNQGKTSVLDSIAWALGGDRFKPSQANREGSAVQPYLKITLSNGIVVERAGKNSSLKVIDSNGNKGGQQLLNEFIESFALNLPKFLQATANEKANILLQIIGVGDRLVELEHAETEKYNERHTIGQIAQQKKKYADEMTFYEGVPSEPISASELIKQQQEILYTNAQNQKKREHLSELREKKHLLEEELNRVNADLKLAELSAVDLVDRSTAELEKNIEQIDKLNIKIRSNLDKERAEESAHDFQTQYETLTAELEKIRADKKKLLDNADLPLPELSVVNGEITYKGMKWDNMSGSEQLRVATAIIRKLNPECGFVLVDKLEQMDTETLQEFSQWLESEELQVIATRVGTGDECSIIIEDGYSVNQNETENNFKPKFQKGVF
nr:MAG TPA: STRUCTURAL MAINTENANCE OF CHROMOSOMES PROTEIN [Bacteriophage sp.]